MNINNKINSSLKYFFNEKGIIIIFLIFSYLALWPILIRNGWAFNHEWLSWRSRLICYALHFKQGDFFPIWSSGDSFGMGSPLPLYYHKLFYYVSAIFYLLFDNVKISIILSLVIFNFIGVYGVYKSLRVLKVDTKIAVFTGICLLFQYYTITDWFIRGSFAEYSALMLVPWLFFWVFNLIINKHYSISIGVLFGLLYHAHSIIAYYSIFLLAGAEIIGLVLKSIELKKTILLNLKTSIIAIVIIIIFNFPIIITSKYYDPSYVKFDISYFFSDFFKYFIDTSYHWNKTWEGYTVEFNPVTIIFCILVFCFSIIYKTKGLGLTKKNPENIFLLFVLVFYSLLQCRFSIKFYEIIPGADYIQFPWRLIIFIQISILMMLGVAFNYLRNFSYCKKLSFIFFLISFSSYPLFKSTQNGWEWFSKEQVESKINEGVFGVGEYMPIVKGFNKPDSDYFKTLAVKGIELKDSTSFVIQQNYENKEQLMRDFKVNMSHQNLVILPYNYSGLELVYISKNHEKYLVPVFRDDNDPRMRINLPYGNYDLTLVLPNFYNLIRKQSFKLLDE